MKFVLHRNPENRNQKIPFPAMQMAGLADAEQLTIQADAGSIMHSENRTSLQIKGGTDCWTNSMERNSHQAQRLWC